MFFLNRNGHTNPHFNNLIFLKFTDKFALHNCLLISKSFHEILPKILFDCFTLYVESYSNTRWVNQGCLIAPFHRTKTFG